MQLLEQLHISEYLHFDEVPVLSLLFFDVNEEEEGNLTDLLDSGRWLSDSLQLSQLFLMDFQEGSLGFSDNGLGGRKLFISFLLLGSDLDVLNFKGCFLL